MTADPRRRCEAAVDEAAARGLRVAPGYLYFPVAGGVCLHGALLLAAGERPEDPAAQVASMLGTDEAWACSLEYGFEGWDLGEMPSRLEPDREAAALGAEVRAYAARRAGRS